MIKQLILKANEMMDRECELRSCDDCKYNISIKPDSLCNIVLRLAKEYSEDV